MESKYIATCGATIGQNTFYNLASWTVWCSGVGDDLPRPVNRVSDRAA